MWILTNVNSSDSFSLIPEKAKYTVGRVGADLELQGDVCVSRTVLHLSADEKLELEDVGSKYGTFLNENIGSNRPLTKGVRILLSDGDRVRFGRLRNVWLLKRTVLATTSSTLDHEETVELKRLLKSLGGRLLDRWETCCTHLTMREVNVTLKLLHALLDQIPVVTTNFWKDLLNAARSGKSDLDVVNYRPRCPDINIDLGSRLERRNLFKDKTFVFLSRKQYDMYGPIVEKAGGASKDLNSGVQKAFLIRSSVIVVQYIPSTQTQSSETISTLADYLQSHSKRIIPEYEIGLAILHCSTEKYCNPSYKDVSDVVPSTESAADDAQDNLSMCSLNTGAIDLVIPETNESITASAVTSSCTNRSKEGSMPDIHIMETPSEGNQQKRKYPNIISSDQDDSSDEEFVKFPKKPRESRISADQLSEHTVPTKNSNNLTSNAISDPKDKPSFLEKSHSTKRIFVETKSAECNKNKRPRIRVLSEDDDDDDEEDLFRFSDTRSYSEQRNEELCSSQCELNDSGKEAIKQKASPNSRNTEHNEGSQQSITKTWSNSIRKQMPKPRILPQKFCVADWLSCSLNKLEVKSENKYLVKEELIKDENIPLDHIQWLDSMRNVVEVQKVALTVSAKSNDTSHYRYKNRTHANVGDASNSTIRNFKKFVRKQNIPQSA